MLYSKARIPRIDNFMVKLTREYFVKAKHIKNSITNTQLIKIDHQLTNNNKAYGLLSPEAFLTLDHQGLIQNEKNVPIIYHWPKQKKTNPSRQIQKAFTAPNTPQQSHQWIITISAD